MNIRNELNKQGYKIRRTHYRRLRGVNGLFKDFAIRELNLGKQIEPTGGKTVVRIVTPEGVRAVGAALCCDGDCYNRKEGIKIALKRACETLGSFGPSPDLSFLD